MDQLTNNSAAFAVNSSSPVTVLLAKTSKRYRIQSDSILSLNVVVEEFIHRLSKHYQKEKLFAMSFTSSLPIPQILEYVNRHFVARQEVVTLEVPPNYKRKQFLVSFLFFSGILLHFQLSFV